jgi:hypothetical protein
MNWISVEDRLPEAPGYIVAITGFRDEGAPVKNGYIVMLRGNKYPTGDEWLTFDYCQRFYLPKDNVRPNSTISYWMPLKEFPFPQEMITNEGLKAEVKRNTARIADFPISMNSIFYPKKRILQCEIACHPDAMELQKDTNRFLSKICLKKFDGNPELKEIQPLQIAYDSKLDLIVHSVMITYEVDEE